jgi:hypothetical protein
MPGYRLIMAALLISIYFSLKIQDSEMEICPGDGDMK